MTPPVVSMDLTPASAPSRPVRALLTAISMPLRIFSRVLRTWMVAFAVCEFAHVFREDNFKADLAANKGVGLEPGQILEF